MVQIQWIFKEYMPNIQLQYKVHNYHAIEIQLDEKKIDVLWKFKLALKQTRDT